MKMASHKLLNSIFSSRIWSQCGPIEVLLPLLCRLCQLFLGLILCLNSWACTSFKTQGCTKHKQDPILDSLTVTYSSGTHFYWYARHIRRLSTFPQTNSKSLHRPQCVHMDNKRTYISATANEFQVARGSAILGHVPSGMSLLFRCRLLKWPSPTSSLIFWLHPTNSGLWKHKFTSSPKTGFEPQRNFEASAASFCVCGQWIPGAWRMGLGGLPSTVP